MFIELDQRELLLILSAVRNDTVGTWGDERSEQLKALEGKLLRNYWAKVIKV